MTTQELGSLDEAVETEQTSPFELGQVIEINIEDDYQPECKGQPHFFHGDYNGNEIAVFDGDVSIGFHKVMIVGYNYNNGMYEAIIQDRYALQNLCRNIRRRTNELSVRSNLTGTTDRSVELLELRLDLESLLMLIDKISAKSDREKQRFVDIEYNFLIKDIEAETEKYLKIIQPLAELVSQSVFRRTTEEDLPIMRKVACEKIPAGMAQYYFGCFNGTNCLMLMATFLLSDDQKDTSRFKYILEMKHIDPQLKGLDQSRLHAILINEFVQLVKNKGIAPEIRYACRNRAEREALRSLGFAKLNSNGLNFECYSLRLRETPIKVYLTTNI